MKTIHIEYFAVLRESAGINAEALETVAATPEQLYQELLGRYPFPDQATLKVAVNDEFGSWDTQLVDGDRLVFIPPVAGG
jgi:molybdopterin converting factor small subunit